MVASTRPLAPPVRQPYGLWLALLAGPTAASLQLSVNYALVKWACAARAAWVLPAVAAVLLAIAVGGGLLGVTHLAVARRDDAVARTWSAESRRLLALMAIGLDALIALFLVNTLIAMAALSPCE